MNQDRGTLYHVWRWVLFCLSHRMFYPYRRWRASVERLYALEAGDYERFRDLRVRHWRDGLCAYPPSRWNEPL